VVLFRTTSTHGIRSAEFSPLTPRRILFRYDHPYSRSFSPRANPKITTSRVQNSQYPKVSITQLLQQQDSTFKSVHISQQCYLVRAADTLLSFATLVTLQHLRFPHDRAYRFTSYIKDFAASDTLFGHVSIQTGAYCNVTAGSCFTSTAVTSRRVFDRHPQQLTFSKY